MTLTLLQDWPSFIELEHEWNELLESQQERHIFHTWDWVHAWAKAAEFSYRPFVIIARETSGELAGIAPLYLDHFYLLKLFSVKTLRFLGDMSSGAEYPSFICQTGEEENLHNEFVQYLNRNRALWDCIWAPNFSGWESSFGRVTKALNDAKSSIKFNHRQKWFSSIPLPETTESYHSSLSKSRRYDIRRIKGIFDSEREISIRSGHVDNSESPDLDKFFALHEQRWRIVDEAGSFNRDPKLKAFYLQFIPKAQEKGWLQLYFLEDSQEEKAVQIAYRYHTHFYAIQEGFDPLYTGGAGNYLRVKIIEKCIEKNIKCCCYLNGLQKGKLRKGKDGPPRFRESFY